MREVKIIITEIAGFQPGGSADVHVYQDLRSISELEKGIHPVQIEKIENIPPFLAENQSLRMREKLEKRGDQVKRIVRGKLGPGFRLLTDSMEVVWKQD